MPRRVKPGFIWIPRPKNTRYSIEIDGTDVTSDMISSEFTSALIGDDAQCKVTLIDSDGDYADTYVGGETIELFLDFSDGTTSVWKGTLEAPKKKFAEAYLIELVGSLFQNDLLDVTVTESYDGSTTVDAILKDLVDTYLSGFTYSNVDTFTVAPVINWDNKPFWDCILDLTERSSSDCYVDSDKDFHMFSQNSKEITEDAIVWNDTLLEIEKFGIDTVDIKNRIIVYGETEGGLQIVYQADDTDSQTTYGIKEKVIKESSAKTYAQAQDLAEAELSLNKTTSEKGIFRCIVLPDVFPGGTIWITDPVQKVNGQFRIIQFTHSLPSEQTKVVISKDATIPSLFKDRRKVELQLQKITNPFKMTNSYNFAFDNLDNMDSTLSSNIAVAESNLKVSSGTTGTMISQLRSASTNITFVHLKVIGDALSGTTYWISTDNGDTYKQVELETKTSVPAGISLRVKVKLNSASTLIDSLYVGYK